MSGKARLALSLAAGVGIVGLLIWRADPGQFVRIGRSLDPGWWAAAIALYVVSQVISTVRWGVLLNSEGINFPLGRLIRLYFAGMFFNLLLPTSVGGDAVRGYILYRSSERREAAAVSVVVERFVGMGTLLLIGLVASGIAYPFFREPLSLGIMVGLNLFFGLLLILVGRGSVLWRPLKGILGRRLPRWRDWLGRAYQAFRLYGTHRGPLTIAVLLSFLLQFVGILAYVAIGRALGMDVPVLYFFLFVPIITAVSMLPITYSGVGIREAMAVLLFSRVGVSAAAAISLTLSWWVTVALISLMGAPLWARGRLVVPREG